MKNTRCMLCVLMAALLLLGIVPMTALAEEKPAGSEANPINANELWNADAGAFLMDTALEAGDTDGVWYTLTATAVGILQLDHDHVYMRYVDYQITVRVNGKEYLGYSDYFYNKPIISLPGAVGDVISIWHCAL